MINQDDILKFKGLIDRAKRIAILSHESPDRDAVGSILSLYQILILMGKKQEDLIMLLPNEFVIKKNFFKYQNEIKFGNINENIKDCDLLIFTDMNKIMRLGNEETIINESQKTVMIDHHSNDADIKTDIYFRELISSNCEIIFEIFKDLIDIDTETSKTLLAGMYDDTGGFRFPGVTKRTLEVASILVDKGADISEIATEGLTLNEKMFEIGRIFMKNLVKDHKRKLLYSYIDRHDIEELGVEYKEITAASDIFIQIINTIEDFNFVFFVKPKPNNKCSISFRSKRDFSVREIAERIGGGGHKNAAGATLDIGNSEEVLKFVLEQI